jgi:hypothetical protein
MRVKSGIDGVNSNNSPTPSNRKQTETSINYINICCLNYLKLVILWIIKKNHQQMQF